MSYLIVTNRGNGDITRREDFTVEALEKADPEYVFIPFWSWYIPPEIYEHWECVVFHMTDLPIGRGGSPLQNLIIRGYKETTITALKCTKEIDAGPIYCKYYPLELTGTADEIYDRAYKIITRSMIPEIVERKPIPLPQVGKPVYFDRWKCKAEDVIRAISTDYENLEGRKYANIGRGGTS